MWFNICTHLVGCTCCRGRWQNFCFWTQAWKAACRALQMMALAISNFVWSSWNYISLSVAAWLVPIPVCWQARIKRLWSHASSQAFLFSNFVRSQPTGEIRTSKSNVIETDGKKIFSSTNFYNFQLRRRCHKLAFLKSLHFSGCP